MKPPLLYKALDAVATAPLRAQKRRRAALHQLLDPRGSNYERVAAVVQVCNGLAPGVAGRWSQRLLKYEELPFARARCSPYAFGSGATVFLIESVAGPPFILKVYRRTLGRNGAQLLALAHYFRNKYATVCAWYGPQAAPGVSVEIWPSSYFIFNSPLLGAPAVGMVQPFVAQEMKDLFLDFTNDELRALMQRDAGLRAQLQFFCRRTLAIAEEEGRCLDFVGRDNVILLRNASGERVLAILDYGIFDLTEKKAQARAAYDDVMQRMERMQALLPAGEQRTPKDVAVAHTVEQG